MAKFPMNWSRDIYIKETGQIFSVKFKANYCGTERGLPGSNTVRVGLRIGATINEKPLKVAK